MHLLLLLLALVLSRVTSGLSESEAGAADWTRRYIGTITSCTAHSHTGHVLVASTHAIALVHSTDGSIVWRQHFATELVKVTDMHVQGNRVITVHADASIKVWDAGTNGLYTQYDSGTSGAQWVEARLLEVGGSSGVVVVVDRARNELLVGRGNEEFSVVQLDNRGEFMLRRVVVQGKGNVMVVGEMDGAFKVWIVDVEKKSVERQKEYNGDFVGAGEFGLVLQRNRQLFAVNSGTLDEQLIGFTDYSLPKTFESATFISAKEELVHLTLLDANGKHYAVSVNSKLSSASFAVQVPASKKVVGHGVSGFIYALDVEGGKFSFTEGTSDKPAYPLSKEEYGSIKKAWQFGSRGSVKTVLLFEEGSFGLFNNNELAWIREEAFAYVKDAVFVDSAPHNAFFSALGVESGPVNFPGFFQRLLTQVKEIQITIMNFLDTFLDSTRMKTFLQNALLLKKERVGQNKALVVLSESGKLAVVDSSTGNLVWKRFVSPNVDSKIFMTKHKSTGALAPEISLVTKSGVKGNTKLQSYDVSKGRLIRDEAFDFAFDRVVQLNLVDENSRAVLLLVDHSGLNAFLASPSSYSLALVKSKAENIFWTLVGSDGIVAGYTLKSQSSGNINSLKIRLLWKMDYSDGVEKIAGVAHQNYNEPSVSGLWVALKDSIGRSIEYERYIQKNILVLATSVEQGDNDVSPSHRGPRVNIFVIHTPSGVVLKKVSVQNAEGPVKVAISQNSILFSYFNTKDNRFEVSAVEMYHKSTDPMNPNIEPEIFQQTYAFPSGINQMKFTHTRNGLSSKMVLFALPSNRILSLPSQLLDCRRPLESRKPTPEEQATGILPYRSYLPIYSQSIISYNQSIAGVDEILVTDTEMESTSLIFSYGLDWFFTQLTPQSFDILNEDFNLPFLILTISAVATGIPLAKNYYKKKRINDAWE